MYQHILIATDLSELAHKGVVQGLELAETIGARATILTVREPLRPESIQAALAAGVLDPVTRYDEQIEADLRGRFEGLQQTAKTYDVAVELVHEIDESPAEAIVRFAEEHDCDLIVMTSHGRRGLRRVMLGSQTAEVLVETTIPVLVVR